MLRTLVSLQVLALRPRDRLRRAPRRRRGQSTAEYALVLLGAAGVALLLITWATKTDKVTRLLNGGDRPGPRPGVVSRRRGAAGATAGQASVELALLLPSSSCSSCWSILQVGLLARDVVLVTHASREAARAAATDPDPSAAARPPRSPPAGSTRPDRRRPSPVTGRATRIRGCGSP